MHEVACGLRDIFTLNGPGRGARVLLALRDAWKKASLLGSPSSQASPGIKRHPARKGNKRRQAEICAASARAGVSSLGLAIIKSCRTERKDEIVIRI